MTERAGPHGGFRFATAQEHSGHYAELDQGVGVCGKEGQSVPVGVGQPSLKIDEITVGGTD